MIYWACAFAVFYVVSSVNGDLDEPLSSSNSSKCRYATGLTVGNRSTELECCETVVHNYYTKVASHHRYLSTFLESLQTWNCPQFKQECERRTFDYTDFTSLMYLRFCNRSEMEEQCYDDILNIVTRHNTAFQTTASTFDELVSKLDLISLNNQDIMNPCVQIAMYDIDSVGRSYFHEIIKPIIPFCSFVWCGFDEKVFINQKVSPWTCMPSKVLKTRKITRLDSYGFAIGYNPIERNFNFFRCRLYLTIHSFVNIVLAVAIVICNATILGVLYLNQEQDVQSIYRLSLAIADFIMGLIVVPINVATTYKHLGQNLQFTEFQNVTGFIVTNDSSLPIQSASVEMKELKDLISDKFPSEYVSAVGFFTLLSLSVSVYSMVAASLDRFLAISRPLRYNYTKAVLAAKIAVASIWFTGIALAVLPIAIPDLGYALVASNLATLDGKPILILFSVIFFFPILLMWSSIIATYLAARPGLRKHDRQLNTDHEMRLLGTLGVMITVFTICVLPLTIFLIGGIFLAVTDITDPENFDRAAATKYLSVVLSLGLVLVSNSLWNCFIYSTRETNFRSAAKLLYKRIAQRLKLNAACNAVSRRCGAQTAVNA